MEIFADAGDEPHAGVEAGDDEDGPQQHLPHPAKQGVGQQGEGLSARLAAGESRPGNAADVGEHGIDKAEEPGGHEPGPDGALFHLPGVCDAQRLDVQGDDEAEVESGQGVHGLVAVQDALRCGQGGVSRCRGAVACRRRAEQTPGKQQQDEGQQGRAEHPAQPLGEPFRMERDPVCCRKEEGGVGPLEPRGFPHQRSEHGKRGAGGAGNSQAGPDGKIDQDGEPQRKPGMDPPGQLGQPPGPGYGHHACNGQADGADGKPGKGQPEAGACLCPQIGRKDQVARPEKHGKQGKPDQQQLFAAEGVGLHEASSFLPGRTARCGFLTFSLVYKSAHVKKRKDESLYSIR